MITTLGLMSECHSHSPKRDTGDTSEDDYKLALTM